MANPQSYPRETVEFVPVNITLDGTPVTDPSTVKIALTLGSARPTDWTDAVSLDGKIGFMLEGLTPPTYPAWYRVWCQITDNPEVPVIDCGQIALT